MRPLRHFLSLHSTIVPDTTINMNLALSAFFLFSCILHTSYSAETSDSSTAATKAPASAAKKTTGASVAGENRAGKMEISDAQLEMALKDRRYLLRQLKCTLGEATCDPVGRRLKTLAPLVIRGACVQCTPTETRQIQKVLLHIQKNFPKEWGKVVRTYA